MEPLRLTLDFVPRFPRFVRQKAQWFAHLGNSHAVSCEDLLASDDKDETMADSGQPNPGYQEGQAQAEGGGAAGGESSSAPRQRHPSLQDQMNKVLTPVEKFHLPSVSPIPTHSSRVKQLHVDEDDYQAHRNVHLHVHHPLKTHIHRRYSSPSIEDTDVSKPRKGSKRHRKEKPKDAKKPCDVEMVMIDVDNGSEDVKEKEEEKAETSDSTKASIVRTDSYEAAVRGFPDLGATAESEESLTSKLCKEPSNASIKAPSKTSSKESIQDTASSEVSGSDALQEKTPGESVEEPETVTSAITEARASPEPSSSKESATSLGSAKAALAKVLARKDSGRESNSDADPNVRPSPSQVALLRGDISRENSSKELKSILKNSSSFKTREDSQKSLVDGADAVAAGDNTGDVDVTASQKKATFIIGGDVEEDDHEEAVFTLVTTAEEDAKNSEADDRLNEMPHFREGEKDAYKRKSHRHHHGHHHSHHHGHHHHHHHHHKKVPTPMDRLRIGSMTKMDAEIYHKMPTEQEEAQKLLTPDLNEMISHRLEDVPGRRRHRIKKPNVSSMVYIGKQSKPQKKISVQAKKSLDRSPHEVFVELDTLHATGEEGELVWNESARWIKFEEDVQQGAERWGKPHVSSLSFHSLLELRKGLEQGSVLLDLNETELPNIMHHVVENMIITDQVRPEDRGDIMRALLLKHSHLYQKKRHKVIPYNFSSGSLLGFLGHREDSMASTSQYSGGCPSATSLDAMEAGLKVALPDNNNQFTVPVAVTPTLHKSPTAKSTLSTKSTQMDIKAKVPILKKIPEDAEATTVLVGAVDFLDKPTMAFVRLARGVEIGTLTAVPLPVRFLFVLLGPTSGATDYNDIGRSISTLMANETFHEMAYRADDRSDLLRGINEFLGDSIVLPPGDFDRRLLEPIARLQRKRLRRRRQKLQDEDGVLKKSVSHEPEDDPLRRTGECFGGLKRDIQRRFPYYVSDFVDGLNFQCLMAFFFIFFTCVTPVITFGGLLSDKTHNHIGVSEMIIATAISGGLFSLLAGQPIIIIAATGPFLVYDQSLYEFCESNGIEFMTWRLWIGLWILVICIITVAFEGGVFVRYVTRFTEEVFAFLISFIFIYEVFKFLSKVYTKNPLCSDCYYYDESIGPPVFNRNGSLLVNTTIPSIESLMNSQSNNSRRMPMPAAVGPAYLNPYADPDGYEAKETKNQPNTALMSTILCFGTFFIAYFLRKFKNSKFLSRGARRGLGDFGLLISIVVMVCIDFFFQDVYTQKLEVPDGFTPTDPKLRGWIINPMGKDKTIQVWAIFAAVIPAFLVYILLFIEIQITEMIINKKENNLKKGSGYHLDLLLICGTVAISGFFGLPWMCAATVRSVSHFESLTVYSKTHAPGEKPKLLSVKEQRLTNLLVHIMMGITMTLQPVLRRIPLAVLFGVFLYLGITSLAATQIFERIGLMFMPPKHHPSSVRYVRKVKTRKIHIFTVIQLVFITLLWIVKSTQAALAFPFLLILLIPFRNHVMKKFYTETEMEALDAESDGDDDDEDVDAYDTARLPF
ncbi:anion exchange protein 2-like isoform X3 [Branchiostoma floridae]|uniref:Anion exchange protein n=1 Tax=Branchiostoma floridae TaxID=7739 RepID=A0A9J7HLH0_BRAFL|nr:anion exchange protein 2-like isoform X3 [Branchiostoma floridae]